MLKQRRSTERQVALFLFGVILLVPPMLSVFNHAGRSLGIPLLYMYLFIAWSGLIAFTLAITRRMRLDELAASATKTLSGEDAAQSGQMAQIGEYQNDA